MSFASLYLSKNKTKPFISEKPAENLHLIVVIPCYNEPQLVNALQSLWNCTRPGFAVETIIVVNSPISSPKEIINNNLETCRKTKEWISSHHDNLFRFFVIYQPDLPIKHAGPGLARKIGMDEAIIRFNKHNNTNGIIFSLDADTLVDKNILVETEKHYRKYPDTNGCSIYFEHPVDGTEYSAETYKGVIQYELYLRYFVFALRVSGFPYAYFTIGSCFSVKAKTYVKQGGMNRKKAGEDFYFLQKVIPLGNFYEINSTRIIPSPRPSDRVPFGTGPMIKKYINSITEYINVYDFKSFLDLKVLFENTDSFFRVENELYVGIFNILPRSVQFFLQEYYYQDKLLEINQNSSSLPTFRKRFYHWFNAFRIVKFMNISHGSFYERKSIISVSNDLLKFIKLEDYVSNDALELLKVYRKLSKGEIKPAII